MQWCNLASRKDETVGLAEIQSTNSKQFMFESHVRLGLKPNTCSENVGEGTALFCQGVDDRCARGSQWCLEHVAKNTQDTVEALVLCSLVRLPLYSRHQLGNDDEINDEWCSKQGILAHIEQADGLVSTHEDLRIVLVQCALVVAYRWHVLNHHRMIRMLALIVQDSVRSYHIIYDVGFGDLFGTELLLRAQVFAVVVAQVVVARDGGQFYTGVDQKIDKSRLHLGLTRLEVVTTNE